MDLTCFKLDIDELLDEYTEGNFTTLADMKRIWIAKKFSYIFEAKPTTKLGLFMQSLFANAIIHMVSTGDLSRRLGGLYCLYCLYETQPFKPQFKIYLSLSELKRLKELVIDAKKNGTRVVPALVKRMLDKNMFLFGFVEKVDSSINERVEEITKLQEKRFQIAYERLLSNTRIEDYLHMDLGGKLDLAALKQMSREYAKAKELAIKDPNSKVGVEDIKHIAENKQLVGDMVEGMVEEWDVQKEAFYKETGLTPRNELLELEFFGDELENILSE